MARWLLLAGLFSSYTGLPRLSKAPSDEFTDDDSWSDLAIQKLWNERLVMHHTPILKFKYPARPDVQIIFKDESATPTGSLKHRYALMLMMWALREGKVQNHTRVFEASSGNTANSLAYMCRIVGVNFTAVVPDTLEKIKQDHIEDQGGNVIKVPIGERLIRAKEAAAQNGGFFMNQFGNADRAEDFHESGNYPLESANLFHELLLQLKEDPTVVVKVPAMFVHAAGTGGTITSVGRYVKKYGLETEVVLADTQFSIYYDYVKYRAFTNESGAPLWKGPGMAGTGFGPMGPARHGETTSLDPAIIDRVLKIPDLASTAAMTVLRNQGLIGGPSSGVNFLASLHLAATRKAGKKKKLVIATILADNGHNYESSYYDRGWIDVNFKQHGGLKGFDCWVGVIERALVEPLDPLLVGYKECGAGEF